MNKVSWNTKNALVIMVDIRKHKNRWTDQEEYYAVIHCGTPDEELKLDKFTRRIAIKRENAFMCFKEEYFRRMDAGEAYSFEGVVSFGYGSTYLTVNRVYDSLGYDLTDESSPCFSRWEEIPLEELLFTENEGTE